MDRGALKPVTGSNLHLVNEVASAWLPERAKGMGMASGGCAWRRADGRHARMEPSWTGVGYRISCLEGGWQEEAQLIASDRDAIFGQKQIDRGQHFENSIAAGEGFSSLLARRATCKPSMMDREARCMSLNSTVFLRGGDGWQEQAHIVIPGFPSRDFYMTTASLFILDW